MDRTRPDVATGLGVAVLFGSGRRARTHEVSATEDRAFRLFNNAPDAIHAPVWAVMQSGSLAAVFVTSAALVRRGRPNQAIATLAAGISVWAGINMVKPLIGRGRPQHHLDEVSVRGQPQTGLGYPSGHGAVAMTLAVIATRDSSPTTRAAAIAIAGLTGGARMYVGAHLPLDVMGGLAIGVLFGRTANAIADRAQTGQT